MKFTYRESVVVLLRKPGDPPISDKEAANAAVTKGTGALPSATMTAQERVTVTVKSIDPATQGITVTTKDGRTVTRKVEDKKFIDGLKAGQTIDIVYTRSPDHGHRARSVVHPEVNRLPRRGGPVDAGRAGPSPLDPRGLR